MFHEERNKFQNLRLKKKGKKKLYRGTFIPSTVIKHDPGLQFTLCGISEIHIQSMSLKSAEGCLKSELLLKSPLLPPPHPPPLQPRRRNISRVGARLNKTCVLLFVCSSQPRPRGPLL